MVDNGPLSLQKEQHLTKIKISPNENFQSMFTSFIKNTLGYFFYQKYFWDTLGFELSGLKAQNLQVTTARVALLPSVIQKRLVMLISLTQLRYTCTLHVILWWWSCIILTSSDFNANTFKEIFSGLFWSILVGNDTYFPAQGSKYAPFLAEFGRNV